MTEHEILSFIHKRGSTATDTDFTAESINSRTPDILSDLRRLECLIEMNYVERMSNAPTRLQLTGLGIFRLDELSKAAKEKRTQRYFEIFLALLSALVGAILSQPLWNWIG